MRRYTEAPFSILNLIFDIVETMLFIRFLFVFFGANRANAFVSFFIDGTQPLIAPFAGIFRNSTAAGLTIEWASIIAMAAYALVFALILRLIYALAVTVDDVREERVHHTHG